MSRKEDILSRLNFEAFYRQELPDLKPGQGDNLLGLCPFHPDTNPSFSVNIKTGLYNCFGCGAAGDVFDFYMRRHGCDFKEALEELARRAGVEEKQDGEDKFLSIFLPDFCKKKHFSEDFLLSWSIRERPSDHFYNEATALAFPYLNESGSVKAIRYRFANKGDKKFRWRKGDKTLPYGLQRLPEIRAAGWCLLVEGETDTLTGWLHGLPFLGVPGATNWKSSFAKKLQDLKVYIWQEPDAAGAKFVEKVARDLPNLLVIQAPPGVKDISAAHCQDLDVPALIADLRKKAQLPAPPPPLISGGFSLSDLGNARRLVAQHGQDLRYNHLAKKWLCWTGKRWRVDDSGEVDRRAKLTVGSIYGEAEKAPPESRKALGAFALRSESQSSIQGMISLAKSEIGIPVNPRELDANHYLLNCQNGTIDLTTGTLRPHRREDLISRLVPVEYDLKAPCDRWDHFLWRIQAENDDVISFLQRSLGYALTGSTREQCLFILWGHGANGKSTLVNCFADLLGDYSKNTPVETLLARSKGSEIPTDIARLDGPRFVTSSEVGRGRHLAESLVKELTGRDTVSARFLYAEYFDFVPQFKLFLSTNHKPTIRGVDRAIWRRIKFIKFPVELPEEEWDGDLPEKLKAQAPGILAWAVRGCLWWYRDGLGVPQEVLDATAEYQAEMDILKDFLDEKCVIAPGASALAGDLYHAYLAWADEAGLTDKERLGQRSFGLALSERTFTRIRSGGKHTWRGLALRDRGSHGAQDKTR